MDVIQIDGRALHFRVDPGPAGSPAVVFVNSLGTDFRIWDGVVRALDGRLGVVLHDKRGHGLSDLGNGLESIGDYAADVAALIEHLGVGPALICGLSVGGLIAQHLLVHRGDLVRGAILSNTGAKVGTDEIWNARIATVTESGIGAISDMVMDRWFSPAFHQGRRDELAIYANMLTRTDAKAYATCCAAIRDADYRGKLANVSCPVLCIGGAHDGSTPPLLVKEMADDIPSARYLQFDDAAHLPCIESPEAYARAVLDFAGTL